MHVRTVLLGGVRYLPTAVFALEQHSNPQLYIPLEYRKQSDVNWIKEHKEESEEGNIDGVKRSKWISWNEVGLDKYAERIWATIREMPEPVNILGHSMGSKVALLVAGLAVRAHSIEKISSIGLLCPGPIGGMPSKRFYRDVRYLGKVVKHLSKEQKAFKHAYETIKTILPDFCWQHQSRNETYRAMYETMSGHTPLPVGYPQKKIRAWVDWKDEVFPESVTREMLVRTGIEHTVHHYGHSAPIVDLKGRILAEFHEWATTKQTA